ncbi:TetR/AcrR family transcriptional regulator [Flocculibacter collagenilyticus]|uniref:TetR/AcrR family transcriptional regulator n=1 Tax=Flocculibacter collagenilyticus TaxID=2744479 RepID=UPI0018F4C04C|nr:TetR/AcrR family transcriptional regulator [Flocculibacter collagenilyticus]
MSTKEKILDAAETLFSENGFSDTSLRQITSEAGVNLASVNYHFGSKKELIQQVLERYLCVVMPALDDEIDKLLDTKKTPNLDDVFSVHIRPLLMLNELKPNGTRIYLKLLGRGYYDSQGHLRKYLYANYGKPLDRFISLIHTAYPELPASEVFWRLHFTLGTAVFTMASIDALSEISTADFNQDVTIKHVIEKVIPFISSGFAAPFTPHTDR